GHQPGEPGWIPGEPEPGWQPGPGGRPAQPGPGWQPEPGGQPGPGRQPGEPEPGRSLSTPQHDRTPPAPEVSGAFSRSASQHGPSGRGHCLRRRTKKAATAAPTTATPITLSS